MNCEIEFMAVGTESRSGDAIVVRYGWDRNYDLMLIDGGFSETGIEIVNHLRNYYGPTPYLSHVLLTHPDADHASGLRTVLEDLSVGALWINCPWDFAQNAIHLFADTWTAPKLEAHLKAEYDIIYDLVNIAKRKNIPIYNPLQGQIIGPFTVLSPSGIVYQHLMPQFDRTPAADSDEIGRNGLWIGRSAASGVMARIIQVVANAVRRWIPETWGVEQLRDGLSTSASNESSVVLYAEFDGQKRVLLTGDAGVNALTWSAEYAESRGIPLQQFAFFQIPHHGSRHNVGPTILDRLIGLPQPSFVSRFTAYVSAPKNDETHPRRIVVNAVTRRGGEVFATQGVNLSHRIGLSARYGYGPATPKQFYDEVESYE